MKETALLTPPAKRDEDWYKVKRRKDGKTTTSKSKGKWYVPVTDDGRKRAARKSNYRSQFSYETGKNTKRNVFPGMSDILPTGRGLTEEKDTTYNEEQKLFEVNNQIKNLITELESKDNEVKTQQEA